MGIWGSKSSWHSDWRGPAYLFFLNHVHNRRLLIAMRIISSWRQNIVHTLHPIVALWKIGFIQWPIVPFHSGNVAITAPQSSLNWQGKVSQVFEKKYIMKWKRNRSETIVYLVHALVEAAIDCVPFCKSYRTILDCIISSALHMPVSSAVGGISLRRPKVIRYERSWSTYHLF